MRFGVQVATERVGWDDTVQMFHQAEEAGLDTAWVPDHFLPTLAADRGGSHPDAWTLLPALAARTSTIRIGVLVTCVGFRHPSVLARAAANVDLISGGRLEFGIGAGWMREEHEWFGMPFPPPGERARRLEEAVQLCKLLWTQPRASFKGRYYWLEEAPMEPKPVQVPHPPVLIGGSGEKIVLRTVAEHADEWNMSGPPSQFRAKGSVLEEHCRTVGRDPGSIKRSVATPLAVTDTPEQATKLAETLAARRGISVEDARERLLAGTPDQLPGQVQAFADAGVSHIIFQVSQPRHMAGAVRFAREVAPPFTS